MKQLLLQKLLSGQKSAISRTLMVVALLVASISGAWADTYSGNCGANGDNLTWSLDTSTGVLTITGSGAMTDYNYDSGYPSTPWYQNYKNIKSVSLPAGLTHIGNFAFTELLYLESITIPSSVTSLGTDAFSTCEALTSISFQENPSLESIDEEVFLGCSDLTSITIPSSVKSIGSKAFQRCKGLTSIYIPNSVTSIGWSAFNQCTGLTSINIPNSVTSIEASTFLDCTGLTSINIPNSVTSIGGSAFSGCSGLTSINIPSSVTSIGSRTFYDCSGLKSVTFGDNSQLASIEFQTFYKCTGLTSITIPSSVTSIGSSAFWCCSGLTSVTIPSSVGSIGSKAFFECKCLETLTSLATTPPTLGTNVFDNVNTSKVTLYVPTSTAAESYNSNSQWNSIGFKEIKAITTENVLVDGLYYNLTIPAEGATNGTAQVTSVPSGGTAYSGDITIPATVTKENVTYDVKSIGNFAFKDCTGLTSITCNATTPPILGSSVFDNAPTSNITLYVPTSTAVASYKTADGWKDITFKGIVVVGTQCVSIDGLYYYLTASTEGATSGTAEVTSVPSGGTKYSGEITIPATVKNGETTYDVKSIGNFAFKDCTGLTSITCNATTPPTLGTDVFSGVTTQNVTLIVPTTSIKLKYQAADGWKDITFNDIKATTTDAVLIDGLWYKLTTPAEGATTGTAEVISGGTQCSGDITINETVTDNSVTYSVTSIGESAFTGCTGLTSITIPTSVTSIGQNAFTGVGNVKYNGGATGSPWGAYAVNGTWDGNLLYSDEAKTNLVYCKRDAEGSIEIPNTVKSIGNGAFYGCSGLTSITCLATTPPTLGTDVFSGVTTSNVTLYVPTSTEVTSYKNADGWKDITFKEIKALVLEIVGTRNSETGVCTGTYRVDNSAPFTLAPGEQLHFKFTNYNNAGQSGITQNNWNNWSLCAIGDNADVFILRADNWENVSNSNSGCVSNFDWTNFNGSMNGAVVDMTVTHSGSVVTVSSTIATSDSKNWTYTYTKSTTATLTLYLGVDASCLKITAATKKGIVKSWTFTGNAADANVTTDATHTITENNTACALATAPTNCAGVYLQGDWKCYNSTNGLKNISTGNRMLIVPDLKANDAITVTCNNTDYIASAKYQGTANGDKTSVDYTMAEDGNFYLTLIKIGGKFNEVDVYPGLYTIKVLREVPAYSCDAPTATITGTDGTARKFTLACATANSEIYYSETALATAEGGTKYEGEVTTSAATIYAYAKIPQATSEVMSFETGAGSKVSLIGPVANVSGMVANGSFYNPVYTLSSDQTSVLGAPTATITYQINGGAEVEASSVTITEPCTLTINAKAEGYTSASTEVTIENAYFKSTKTFNFRDLLTTVGTESAGDNRTVNGVGCAFYKLDAAAIDGLTLNINQAWAITNTYTLGLYARAAAGSVTYKSDLNGGYLAYKDINSGNTVLSPSTTINFATYGGMSSLEVVEPATTYTVNVSNFENGTVTVSPTKALAGTTITVTAVPNNGYELTSIKVGDTDITEAKSFTMPENDVTVSATFTPVYSYSVKVMDGDTEVGTIKEGVAEAGTVIQWSKYNKFNDKWYSVDTYSMTVSATASENVIKLPATATDVVYFTECENMTMSHNAAAQLEGTQYSGGVAPRHYQSSYWYGDAVSTDAGTYTLSMPCVNNTSTATTLGVYYRNAEGNLSAEALKTFTVDGKTSTTVTVSGVQIPASGSLVLYNTSDYNSNVYIDYVTLIKEYTVTVADGIENGTITVPATAAPGTTVTITATPNEAYELSAVTVKDASGNDVEVTDNTSFTMPASKVTISATFSASDKRTYTIKAKAGDVELSTITTGKTAQSQDFTVTGLPRFVKVDSKYYMLNDEDVIYSKTSDKTTFSKTFTMGTESATFAVSYEENANIITAFEGEDINTNSATDDATASNGKYGYVAGGKTYTIGTLPPGTYNLVHRYIYASNRGFVIRNAANDVTTDPIVAKSNWHSGTEESLEFTLDDATTITLGGIINSSNKVNQSCDFDYAYLIRTGGNEIIGAADKSTPYRGDKGEDIVLNKGLSCTVKFKNHGTSEQAWYNWLLDITSNNTLVGTLRADWYLNAGAESQTTNGAFTGQYKASTDGGTTTVSVDWGTFMSAMQDATVELNLAYSSEGVLTVKGTATSGQNIFYYDYSISKYTPSGGSETALGESVTLNLSVEKAWLEVNGGYIPKSLTLAATDDTNYWATFSDADNVTFWPTGKATVKKATVSGSGNTATLTLPELDKETVTIGDASVEGYFVPANTGVLIKATGTSVNYYKVTGKTVADLTDNYLYPGTGAVISSPTDCLYYMLAYSDATTKANLGFYWGADNGGVFTSRKGAAYLAIPTSSGAKISGFAFDGDTATGITDVNADTNSNAGVRKVWRNGQLVILRDNKIFSATGAEIK